MKIFLKCQTWVNDIELTTIRCISCFLVDAIVVV